MVALLAIFCCFLWGSAFPSVKTGYRLFQIASDDTASVLLFAGIRFTGAGVMVLIAGSILQKKVLLLKKEELLPILKVSSIQTVLQYVLFYIGLAHASGITSSIMEASNVFLAILVAALIFHTETLDRAKILGCILGFIGVILVNLNGESLTFHMALNGEGFVFLSALSYAFSSVMIKHYGQTINPVVISGWQFFFGGLVMTLLGAVLGGSLNATVPYAYLLLTYMCFISAAAYTVWGILLKYNDISTVSIYGFTNPMFGVILSAIILKEQGSFGILTMIALLFVCAGIYFVNGKKSK